MDTDTQSTSAKAATVFNRTVPVEFTDGTVHEWDVRQVQLGEYKRAFALVDDEFALAAHCTGRSADMIQTNLTPESYERLATAVREVNSGFFGYVFRRVETQMRMMGVIAEKPATSTRSPI
jgi:hypothetical protein